MTRHDTPESAYEPVSDRWDGGAELSRVITPGTPSGYTHAHDSAVTWPSAVIPGGHYQQAAGLLTLNALLAPDLPRPALPDWTQVPNRFHIWPGLAAATWAGFGFWAHTEPLHALFAVAFGAVGAGTGALGALGIAAGNTVARDADAEPPDKGGTRALLGIALAAFAGAASTGAGFSGIGCMLTAGTAAAGYGGYFAWRRHERHRAIQALISFAAASNPGPLPPGLPLPPIVMPSITSPFEARILNGLEAMKVTGAWVGPPRRITDDVHSAPFELPASANMSPKALAKKEAQLANNIRARRVEIEATHGARGTVTVYDGPDRTDDTYPWDGHTVDSIDRPVLIGYDEAGRPVTLVLHGRILIGGASGSGKSHVLNNLLMSTLPCQNLVRIGMDCKPGAPELGPYEPVMHFVAKTPREAMAVLHGIAELIKERGQILAEQRIPTEPGDNGEPVRKWRYEFGPRVATVMDEIAELTRWEPDAPKLMESNRQLGRYVFVDAWDATQGPSANAFGGNTDGRQQYDIRIGLRAEPVVNNLVFGQGASGNGWRLEDLDRPGKLLLAATGLTKPRPIKCLLTDDTRIASEVASWTGRVAVLDERSAEAFQRGFDAYMAAAEENAEGPTGGGGPRGGRMPDPIQAAQDFHGDRPVLWIVPKYPDGEPIEAKHRALWDLLGSYGNTGAFASEIAAKRLDGFTSESGVRSTLRFWVERGYAAAEKDGRADRFVRIDRLGRGDRRQA